MSSNSSNKYFSIGALQVGHARFNTHSTDGLIYGASITRILSDAAVHGLQCMDLSGDSLGGWSGLLRIRMVSCFSELLCGWPLFGVEPALQHNSCILLLYRTDWDTAHQWGFNGCHSRTGKFACADQLYTLTLVFSEQWLWLCSVQLETCCSCFPQ